MKPQGSQPKRFLQNGLLIYSSATCHHQKSGIRGFLYKKTTTKSFFSKKEMFLKRYFIIEGKAKFI